MKRKELNCLCLLMAIVFMFSGCFSKTTPNPTAQDFYDENSDFTIGNSTLSYNLTEYYMTSFSDDVSACNAGNGNYSQNKMYLKVADLSNRFAYIGTQAQLAYIYYSLYRTDEKWSDAYTFASEAEATARKEYIGLLKNLYYSKYSEAIFEGWSQDEIDYILSFSDGEADIQTEYDSLIVEYYAINDDEEYNSNVENVYKRIVTNRQTLAKAYDYANYAEFAYAEVYGRDYTPSEVDSMISLVKEYLVPLYVTLDERLYEMEESANFAQIYMQYDFYENTPFYKMFDTILPYLRSYDKIGKYFDHFFSNKTYFLGFDPMVTAGMAFTTYLPYYGVPAIFFGADDTGYYQKSSTLVHEIGHYASYVASNGGESMSYDIAEMQSQGNEWLYTYYLKDCMPEDVYSYYYYNYFADSLFTVIIACAIEEFEQYVFTAQTLENVSLDDKMNEICATYGELSSVLNRIMPDYWRSVCPENPEYYISYAMSMIPSIELYAIAQTNGFDKAKSIYENVVCEFSMVEFKPFLTDLGIFTPFEEDAYLLINDML